MNQTAIRIENIGKKYRIQHQKAGYDSLAGAFSGGIKNLFRSTGSSQSTEDFWALKDISLDIQRGDRVGVIGRNGAGKSTLLKVLSRIVKPSTGRIEFEGRMASLLEVGTGFHGDLTGRENIYLNGSILGMSKREIDAKFDEIVAFSEIEKFLDTPVKRYSSGMYVRLAFAVAAHLEPDILIVDEVLAVGDAQFQRKCLGKMEDVSSKEGRTILFVSHQMGAVQNLCDKCLYLKNGELISFGKTEEVIPEYLRASQDMMALRLHERKDRTGNGALRFHSFSLKNRNSETLLAAHCGDYLNVEVNLEAYADLTNVLISFGIDDEFGQRIAHCSNEITDQIFTRLKAGQHTVQIQIPKLPLKSGAYTFTLFSSVNSEIADWLQDAGSFEVESGDFFNTGKLPPDGQGQVFIEHQFKLL